MRRLQLCLVVTILLAASAAQAGELYTLLDNGLCKPHNENAKYCQTYIGFRVTQGMNRDNAYNSCVQQCGSYKDATESSKCKIVCDSLNKLDPSVVDVAKNTFCVGSQNLSVGLGCVRYWTPRFQLGGSRDASLEACITFSSTDSVSKAECANQNQKDK